MQYYNRQMINIIRNLYRFKIEFCIANVSKFKGIILFESCFDFSVSR